MATPRSAERPAAGPMAPAPYRVVGKRQDTEDTWTLGLEPQSGPPPPFKPGQFNMIYAFGVGEVPISICGDPTGAAPLEHTVRAVGATTQAICASQPGEFLGVRGPFGSAWPTAAAEGRDLVVVAGGIGLAPLRPVLLHAAARGRAYRRVILLYGGRSPDQLLYTGELEAWRRAGISVALTVDSATGGWDGSVGTVTTLLDAAGIEGKATCAMLCGPEIMMRFAIAGLRERDVDPADIHISMERNMECAIVSCGHCQFGPTLVCRDGPVLRFSEVEPWLEVREL